MCIEKLKYGYGNMDFQGRKIEIYGYGNMRLNPYTHNHIETHFNYFEYDA